jgi:hypothetical protein
MTNPGMQSNSCGSTFNNTTIISAARSQSMAGHHTSSTPTDHANDEASPVMTMTTEVNPFNNANPAWVTLSVILREALDLLQEDCDWVDVNHVEMSFKRHDSRQ